MMFPTVKPLTVSDLILINARVAKKFVIIFNV